MTRLQKDLAGLAQYFEDRAPWDGRFKRQGFNIPIANAVNVLVATGDAGPMPPIGINLPNEEEIRERYGNKSVSLVNVMDSYGRAVHAKMVDEFFLPEDRALQQKFGSIDDLLQTTMHEVLGHASGKVSDALKGDPRDHLREYYSALEEARAELIALFNFFDPKLVEIGAIPSPEAAEAAYRDYATNDLYLLRRVRHGDVLEDDHMRATHLIVGYLREVTGAVELVRRDGKTYSRVKDIAAMRRGVAELLGSAMRCASTPRCATRSSRAPGRPASPPMWRSSCPTSCRSAPSQGRSGTCISPTPPTWRRRCSNTPASSLSRSRSPPPHRPERAADSAVREPRFTSRPHGPGSRGNLYWEWPRPRAALGASCGRLRSMVQGVHVSPRHF